MEKKREETQEENHQTKEKPYLRGDGDVGAGRGGRNRKREKRSHHV